MTVSCARGWTDRDAVWDTDLGGPREPHIKSGPGSPMLRGNFERDDVQIFPHAAKHRFQWPWHWYFLDPVDRHSDWPATEALRYHIKFSRWKIPLQCGLLSKFVDHLLLILWCGDDVKGGDGVDDTIEENCRFFSLLCHNPPVLNWGCWLTTGQR